jgi:hypothetical protein
MLATITSDLDKIAPRFEMQPEQITIIQSPAEFYATLKVGDYSILCSINTYVLKRHHEYVFLFLYFISSLSLLPS